MDCDARKDLLMELALGVLEGAERDELRAHLQSGCPVCQGRLAEAHAVLAMLALSIQPVSAPASARRRLLDRLDSTSANRNKSLKISDRGGNHTPFSSIRWMAPAIFGGAVAAGITVLVFVNILTQQRKSFDNLKSEVVRKDDEIIQLRTSAQEGRDMKRLVSSPAVQVVTLHGSPVQPKARGQLIWDRPSKSFRFFAADLANLAPGQAYELWLIDGKNKKIAAGMCKLSSDGRIEVASSLKTDPGVIVAAAVTNEPLAGVRQPTGQIQLVGQFN